jgi:hypothetical protein
VLEQKVWLFNSKLWLFPGKLHSKWDGPFIATSLYPHGVPKLQDPKNGNVFKVNGQILKSNIQGMDHNEDMESIDLEDPVHLL